MKTTLELDKLDGNFEKIEVDYKISGASVYFNIPDINPEVLISVFLKDSSGAYYEYSSCFGGQVRVDFLNAGENSIVLSAQSPEKLLWRSNIIGVTIKSIEPVYSIQDDKVFIRWNKVDGAEGYMLYTKTDNGVFTSLKEFKTPNAVLYSIPKGIELKIKPFVRKDNKRDYVFKNKKFVLEKDAAENTELKAIPLVAKSTVNLMWTKIPEADNYKIYIRVNGKVKTVDAGDCNTYIEQYLPTGIARFCVKAFKGENCISTSPVYTCNIKDIDIVAINKDYKIYLYWNKSSGVDGYRVFKKNENNEFAGFLSTKEERAVLEDIIPGEICEFKVKPFILKDGQRVYNSMSAKCKITAFTSNVIKLMMNEAYGGQMSLSWIFDGDVDGFKIYKNDEEILDINDGLCHIAMLEYSEDNFKIKGYKKLKNEYIFTCESEIVNITTCKTSRKFLQKPEEYVLSVIIPAYNAENYISRCISTVLGCNFKDLEVVVVDDESKDNTKEILEWYERTYPDYVKVFSKKNGGVADTRNYAIERVLGKYTAFMDNDDMIRPEAFTKLVGALEKTNSDISIGELYRIENDGYSLRLKLPFRPNTAVNPEDYLRLIFSGSYSNIGIWNKVYRTSLVKEHPLPLLAYEDVSWTPYIISWANKLCFVNEPCYEWDRKIRGFTLSNVLSGREVESKFEDRLEAVKFFYENGNPKYKEVLAYLYAKRMYGQGKKADYDGYFNAISDMKEELINNKFLLSDEEYYAKISPFLKNSV